MEDNNTFYDVTIRSGGYILADFYAHPFFTIWTAQQAIFYEQKFSPKGFLCDYFDILFLNRFLQWSQLKRHDFTPRIANLSTR